MKEFTLSKIYTNRYGKYEIPLGNGAIHQFTNLKDAKKFLVATNDFLTKKLFALNELYIQVFAQSQRTWFLRDKGNGNRVDDEKDKSSIKTFYELIDIAVRKAGENENYLAFINLNKACKELVSITVRLRSLHVVQKKDTLKRYDLDKLISNIQDEEEEIRRYSTKEPHLIRISEKYTDLEEYETKLKVVA